VQRISEKCIAMKCSKALKTLGFMLNDAQYVFYRKKMIKALKSLEFIGF
jgi:hypothetical protein